MSTTPESQLDAPRHWINTVSREHVLVGMKGGFMQADHGRATRLRRLGRGDWVTFYSPRTSIRAGDAVQRFTAIGTIVDDVAYRVEMREDFHPWRRRVAFVDAREASIRPLLQELSFVTNPARWGWYFRRGLFEVVREDMTRIAEAMGVSLGDEEGWSDCARDGRGDSQGRVSLVGPDDGRQNAETLLR